MAHGSKHPHVRGEDLSIPSALSPSSETPPRAWGRLETLFREFISYPETPPRAWGRHINGGHNNFRIRNTPTCVGKTSLFSQIRGRLEKHPHVRGEDSRRGSERHLRAETPPRAWGRQHQAVWGAPEAGNTPTCVGKTSERERKIKAERKHPHVRGEDLLHGMGA